MGRFPPIVVEFLAGPYDGTVRIWDVTSGAELNVLRGHEGDLDSVAFSADNRRISSGSADNTVRVWDAESGECLEITGRLFEVTVIAGGPEQFPFRAITQALQSIDYVKTEQPIAWFPIPLNKISTHPGGRMWAGANTYHMFVLQLEGEAAL